MLKANDFMEGLIRETLFQTYEMSTKKVNAIRKVIVDK